MVEPIWQVLELGEEGVQALEAVVPMLGEVHRLRTDHPLVVVATAGRAPP
jgi:hypothetical protein